MRRAVLFLLFAAAGLAQTGRGVITGQVTDARAAVIPDVEVVATSQETGIRFEAPTNETGIYSILNLPPGTYAVSFRKAGMKPHERQGVTISVNQTARLDVALEVGALTESITVTGNVSMLSTETTDVGTGIDHRTILDLPLQIDGGRQLESFAYAITPGVEGDAWTSYVNGGAAFSKEVLLDGTSQVVQIGGDIEANSPSLEAVEQFKVETSGMPAEYGRTGGGVFVFAMKSGTNQFHGSGVGFLRNEVLNANSWNNNFLATQNPQDRDTYKRQRDRQWTYAGSIGGPIIKNKTFFFGAFERFSRSDYAVGALSATVPTSEFLGGDFSALLDRNAAPLGTDGAGNPIYPGAIFDPQTGNVFAGNIIPQGRFSAVSKRIVDIYQTSYQPLLNRVTNNNARLQSQQPSMHAEQFSLKLDHNINERHKLTGSYIIVSQPRLLIDDGSVWNLKDSTGGPFAWARWQDANTASWRASHSFIVSPTVMNVLNFTYGKYYNGSTAAAAGGDWLEKLGLGTGVGNFPSIRFGSAVNGIETSPIGSGTSGYYVSNVFILNDVLSWTKGKHTFKFGFDGRLMQMSSHSPAEAVQSYEFSNAQTGAPTADYKTQVGFGFASFLLGAVEKASAGVPVDLYGRRKYIATFVQDDFKATSKLTLNLGLRWEMTTPLTEKYGHWGNFDYNLTNTNLGIPGALAFANNGSTSFMKHRDWSELGPRIGAAYRVTDRIVARAAYGILYAPLGLNFWKGVPYGFAPGFQGVNQVNANTDFSAAFNWDNGYPGTVVPGSEDPNRLFNPMVRIDPNSLTAGRLHQWNAGLEFEIAKHTVLGANYVGTKATRLQSDQFERNQPDGQALTRLISSGNEWSRVYDQASADAAGVPYPYAGYDNYAWAALAPYPQLAEAWAPLYVLGVPKGSSSYKALELTLARSGARGLNTNVSYTLSRARGNVNNAFEENWWNGTIQDVTRLDQEAQALQAYDITHIFKGYASYELPFGKGQPFLSGASRVANAVVSGWSVAGLFRYQSGMPLRIASNNWYQVWGGIVYANVGKNGDFSRHFDASRFNAADPGASGNRYFTGTPFTNPAYGEFGTGPLFQPDLRGFGSKQESVSILKNFWVGERIRLQFRAEFTNIFNRHYFDNPDTDINSATFGQVKTVSGDPRQGQLGIRVDW